MNPSVQVMPTAPFYRSRLVAVVVGLLALAIIFAVAFAVLQMNQNSTAESYIAAERAQMAATLSNVPPATPAQVSSMAKTLQSVPPATDAQRSAMAATLRSVAEQ